MAERLEEREDKLSHANVHVQLEHVMEIMPLESDDYNFEAVKVRLKNPFFLLSVCLPKSCTTSGTAKN